ncbi:RNA trimethylguanosine synthase [Fragilaria crotonensis]|nr:RNA trimethylguanosine synthase [Fragilaria crotonensis]
MPSNHKHNSTNDAPDTRQPRNPGAANRGAPSDNYRKNRSPHRNNNTVSPMMNRNHAWNQGFANHDADHSRKPAPQPCSMSPKRANARSKSPKKDKVPAPMTVICNRVNLYDCLSKNHHYDGSDDEGPSGQMHLPHPNLPVAPYHFETPTSTTSPTNPPQVAVVRAPRHAVVRTPSQQFMPDFDVIDNVSRNPIPALVHDKYWAQRRRLFWKFDMGIQLDPEGWYSVTPEVIANHVAQRVASLAPPNEGFILMDAFCGCGGNAIAFGKQKQISLIVCADIDRSKLRKAAYNACLYEIPQEKLIFVECSSLFLLQHCYHDGVLCLEDLKNATNLPNVETEVCAGFFIGGLGMLPHRIDAVFMDPPWGGVDYNSVGKNGYCLEKHMKIKLGPHHNPHDAVNAAACVPDKESSATRNTVGDDFFDTFGSSNNSKTSSKYAKHNFNQKADESDYWNGVDLLKVAAAATKTHLVIYDMPRNTSKASLGRCALAAGYRGNLKLEEHFLNGRLKTITAYMGADYSSIVTAVESHGDEDLPVGPQLDSTSAR